jgi:uncharacterized protein YjaG (DUF416 family)
MEPIDISSLKSLDFIKQLSFAYLTCERLYPNYVFFSENNNFGNPLVLRESIDYLFNNLFQVEFNQQEIEILIKKVDSNTPEPGDFDTLLASSALDACTSLLDSLNFVIDKDFSRIENISTYATDTVHMYVQEIEDLDFNNDPDFDGKIYRHPLMKKELTIQSGIINFLMRRKSFDREDLQTLLNLQENNSKGNLNL